MGKTLKPLKTIIPQASVMGALAESCQTLDNLGEAEKFLLNI